MMNEHTAEYGDDVYDIIALREYAESLPTEFVSVESLRDAVGDGHKYWLDKNSEMFGPAVLLRDWTQARNNPIWIEHVEAVRRANLTYPLWLGPDGSVFDGMHRLTRAFVDGVKEVSVKRFREIPKWAIVKQKSR